MDHLPGQHPGGGHNRQDAGGQTQTAIKTAEKHAEIELAKVQGELERLRRAHSEAKRSHRQDSYQSLLQAMNRLDMYGTGFPLVRRAELEPGHMGFTPRNVRVGFTIDRPGNTQ